MRYKVDGKNVTIPDEYIEKNMRNLGLTRQECVDMYLSDEGIEINPVVTELTDKAKAAGTGAKAAGDKAKRKPPVRKPDEVKRAIVAALAEFVTSQEHVTNVVVTNVERMIAFELGDEKFEITLTKKRKPKEV